MHSKKTIVLALALTLAGFGAAAQQAYVAIEQRLSAEQLREVGLSPTQLALLNRMLRESAEKHAPAAAPQVAQAQGTDTSAPPRNGGARQFIGLNDEPIKSRLKGAVSGWEPGTVFELENGQQWKVLKGRMALPKTLQAPEIVVVPGVAGRWFLQVDEDTPKARVYRID